MTTKCVYKVIFHNHGRVYEIYARDVRQGDMLGFIEVEKLLFGERSSVVLDPSEEGLKTDFKGVDRTYIPIHSIIRIDEVEKEGAARVTESESSGNIMQFPIYSKPVDTDT